MAESSRILINYDDRQQDELTDLLIKIDGIEDHEFRTEDGHPVVELAVRPEKHLNVKQQIEKCNAVQTFDTEPVKHIRGGML
ncbi:hypothetical protein C477_01495 [Haloterrigena salina JCM 13891]|uniref:Uncharacterized protein n=1 Tax=Haloterrigena salina JCM 13891 TaxID=1227488 RepID=M0CKQ6_9EURY|nr:hypothetical protein [Haloterrigena salina]ELZ23831.1 hypothetical protein C477_01495 [Haloterrigena salina JCM 13891]